MEDSNGQCNACGRVDGLPVVVSVALIGFGFVWGGIAMWLFIRLYDM